MHFTVVMLSSSKDQEKVTEGREGALEKMYSIVEKAAGMWHKGNHTAQGHQMKAGSILHYVVQPIY